jgi:hypothetical protein
MPPRRETAPAGVAIIGLQTDKGFRLSSTPEHTPLATTTHHDDSQDNTTTPPGRGMTHASAVVVGPTQYCTELSPEDRENEAMAACHKPAAR